MKVLMYFLIQILIFISFSNCLGVGKAKNKTNRWEFYLNNFLFNSYFGKFTNLSNMNYPRRFHSSTVLTDGNVLISGGAFNSSNDPSEIYNSNTGQFTSTGSMMKPRGNHTAHILENGNVMIIGGNDNNATFAQTEVYLPSSNTFENKLLFAAITVTNPARYAHSATTLNNGKILVVGGFEGGTSLKSAFLYDPSTDTAANTGEMALSRSNHTATILPNGNVIIIGGFNSTTNKSTNTAELYNTETGTFSQISPMNFARFGHASTLLDNEKILISGGFDSTDMVSHFEIYNISAGQFTTSIPMSQPRYTHSATILKDGRVLLAGGLGHNTSKNFIYLNSAEIFNPTLNISNRTQNLNTFRANHSAISLQNGSILITGGKGTNDQILNSAELYTQDFIFP
jgi:N-acetylneuraminic acid mutarotase